MCPRHTSDSLSLSFLERFWYSFCISDLATSGKLVLFFSGKLVLFFNNFPSFELPHENKNTCRCLLSASASSTLSRHRLAPVHLLIRSSGRNAMQQFATYCSTQVRTPPPFFNHNAYTRHVLYTAYARHVSIPCTHVSIPRDGHRRTPAVNTRKISSKAVGTSRFLQQVAAKLWWRIQRRAE